MRPLPNKPTKQCGIRFPADLYAWLIKEKHNPTETLTSTVIRILYDVKTKQKPKK